MSERSVAVIGGGITGLATACALLDDPSCRVTVLEAQERIGGVIRTTPFAGRPAVDEGADAFLVRVPWAVELARRVGLGDQLTSPATGRAAIWWDGLHDIPPGVLLGMPTDLAALARTRLLPTWAKARAALDLFARRTSTAEDSLGGFIRARFGDAVQERLVDPLVGSIYAADTDRLSLAAVPQIAELARSSRSVIFGARHRPIPPTGPVFHAPLGGVGALVDAIAATIVGAGYELRRGAPVAEVMADGSRWRVDGELFDAVVLACPAAASERILAITAPEPAAVMRSVVAADVALVTMAIARQSWPHRLVGLSGYLVPKPRQSSVTAVSFSSQKWSHLGDAATVLLRASIGRDGAPALHADDAALIAAALGDLERHLGVALAPSATRVSRWEGSFPQYRPHHAARVEAIERALPAGLAIAGASWHGVGIPACIHSGQRAAARVCRVGAKVDR